MKTLPSVGFGPTHGYLYIHAAPKAVLRNVEWSLAEALQIPVSLSWQPQPLLSGSHRSEITWSGIHGSAARIESALKGWHYLTFELLESSSNGSDGSLYMFTPELGLFRGTVGPHGDLMVNENQIRKILDENLKSLTIIDSVENLLGKKWDEALDPFRHASIDGVSADARLSV